MTKLINALDVDDVRESTAPTQADVDRITQDYMAQRAGDLPPHPTGPPTTPRKHRALSTADVAPMVSRPWWQSMATPEKVAEAWEVVQGAADALKESSAAVRALSADQQREASAYAAEVERAVKAGAQLPVPTRVDWEAEKVRRETVDRVRQQQLRAARGRYDEVVEDHLPTWRARVAEEVERRREEARQGLTAAAGPVSHFVSAASALDAMTPAPDFDPRDYLAEARAQLDPRAIAYAPIRAGELAQQAKAAWEEDCRRVQRARHALEVIAEALEA